MLAADCSDVVANDPIFAAAPEVRIHLEGGLERKAGGDARIGATTIDRQDSSSILASGSFELIATRYKLRDHTVGFEDLRHVDEH
jgi:hypothetical protein